MGNATDAASSEHNGHLVQSERPNTLTPDVVCGVQCVWGALLLTAFGKGRV